MKAHGFQPQGNPLAFLALAIAEYGTRLQELPERIHPSWTARLAPELATAAAQRPSLFAAAMGIRVAGADAFRNRANLIALLPREECRRVLRARALIPRRNALRHCLDASLRQRLSQWIHPVVFNALITEGADAPGSELGLPVAPSTATDAMDDLAWEGFCLLERDQVWTEPSLVQLLRVQFSCTRDVPALSRSPVSGDASSGQWVVDRLGSFAPEVSWLCG